MSLVRNGAAVAAANVGRSGAVFLVWTLVARQFGPAALAPFAVAYSVIGISAQLAESGLGLTAVKFAASAPSVTERDRILHTAFKARAWLALLLASAGWLLSPIIALTLLDSNGDAHWIQLGCAGGFLSALHGAYLTHMQALSRFRAYLLIVGTYACGLLVGAACLLIHPLSVDRAFLIFVFAMGLSVVPAQALARIPLTPLLPSKSLLRTMSHMSRWMFGCSIIAIVLSQADILILRRFSPAAQLGYYATAQRLAFAISLVSTSLVTALAPSIFGRNRLQYPLIFQRVLKSIPWLFVVTVVCVLCSQLWLGVTFGPKFLAAAPVFSILAAAYLASLPTHVFNLFSLGASRPAAVFYSMAPMLASMVVLGPLLGSRYGAAGMAACVLLGRVFGALVGWIQARRQVAAMVGVTA